MKRRGFTYSLFNAENAVTRQKKIASQFYENDFNETSSRVSHNVSANKVKKSFQKTKPRVLEKVGTL